ncbi:MAG TPA: SPOR domain-containing protein [Longimicrobiales bacterium]|nr:SPOR domain-containing protein [Longimicrobiales bacterium]
MSPEARPAAVLFDPGSSELPPGLGQVLTEPETPILLLVAAEANHAAAHLAIGLAEARARQGRDTLLADADLDAPRLHRLLDVSNLEGLVDVFLFGASLPRVSVRPQTHSFEFVPAGAYAPDPAEVLESARWDRIAEDLAGAEAVLLVHVPAAAAGVRELSRRVGSAVLLGDERSAERAAERLDPSCRILAVVQRPDRMAPDKLAAQAAPASTGAATIFDGPQLTEPVVIRARKPERTSSPLLLVLLLLLLAAAGWLGYQEFFGGRTGDGSPVDAVAAAEPTPPPRGALVEMPLPFSVAVELHQDLNAATERVRRLGAAERGVSFQLSPVSVNGVLYYRLLAGALPDREAGAALMQRLVDAGHKSGMDDWAVRQTSHAFDLGEYETEAEARARVEALRADGIPAYALPQRYEGGQVEYRVYGGAYVNEAEAEVMEQMLEDAGEEARLVERTGEPTG